jgi:Lysylphosphatidylglycerol synthase TM region
MTEVDVSMTSGSSNSSKQRSAGACDTAPQGKAFRMRVAVIFLVGVGISAALIAYHSFFGVARGVREVGWGLGFIIAIYFLGIALNSLAWRGLFHSERPGLIKTLFPLRWIRESINYLLPSAVFGGDIVGGRLLVGRGYDMNTTTASIVVDKTLEAAGLFFFVLAGIFILLEQGGNHGIAHWAVRGLAAISALLIAFLLAQRWGFLRLVDKAAHR